MCGLKIKVINFARLIATNLTTTNIYQVQDGTKTEWVTSSEWLERQKFTDTIKNYNGGNYGNTKQQIKRVLPLSNQSCGKQSEPEI